MFTVGSLFDGSGGFPLAAFMCGGVPVWASEIEPYPIAVTKTRFPYVKHLGSVTNIKGNEIDPVDVITFGSPCQDLSVAGLRKGLKHEDNGDDETTRSGLFMEAVRIAKEMREATGGKYPRLLLWENVPGAFSSNKGEDFRVVCEELIKIVEPSATMPPVPKAGWAYADYYCGDGWSLAYRVLDAQYWGVPQRRKRCFLVVDLGGERAGEILFKSDGLHGYFEEGRTPWQGVTGNVADCVGTADFEGECITLEPGIAAREGGHIYEGVSGTLRANAGDNQMAVAYIGSFLPQKKAEAMGWSTEDVSCTLHNGACAGFQNGVVLTYDARGNGDGSTASTITGDHENRITDYTSVVVEPMCCIDGDKIGKAERSGGSGLGIRPGDKMYTLTAKDAGTHAVAYGIGNGQANQSVMEERTGALNCMHDQQAVVYTDSARIQHIVRRLTPTECARLQGFPDNWGHPDKKSEFTDEEYRFWLNVRNTHAEINGKATNDYTKDQMLKWYNKLHTDSSEYKMWGNGIALPCALYVMQGIAEVFK